MILDPSFLSELSVGIDASPTFIESMAQHLASDFLRRIGSPLPGKALLLPSLPDQFQVRQQGPVSWVAADLLMANEAVAVKIAWRSTRGIAPLNPQSSIQKDEMDCWWDLLPVEEIKRQLLAPQENPYLETDFPFKLRYEVQVLPHVVLWIEARAGLAVEISEVLARSMLEWNAFDDGLIHQVGGVSTHDRNWYAIHLDLGSSAEDGLEHILKKLGDAKLDVTEVRVVS